MIERRSGPYRGPLTEDVHFDRIGESPYYSGTTEGSIHYVPVLEGELILLYLWFADDDSAGSCQPRRSAQSLGNNAAVSWNQLMRKAKADGLSPSAAVTDFVVRGEAIPGFGHIDVATGLQPLSSLSELKELAAQ